MKKLIVALLVFAMCVVAPAVAVEWGALPTNMMVKIDAAYPPGDQFNTYFDVYLEENSEWVVYPGWCVDTSANSITHTAYTAYLSSTIGVSPELNKVNWVLNNKGDASWCEIQAAIWCITNQNNPHPAWFTSKSQDLVDMADDTFTPEDCDVGAILVEPCVLNGQTVIIEVPIPCTPPVPEFPTMMIPVFLVGSVMVAASVLKRE